MEGTFNSIEQFEQVLYKTVEKAGETSLGKFMSLVSSEDKDKIRELYGVEKIGTKIVELLEAAPEKYIFISRFSFNNLVDKYLEASLLSLFTIVFSKFNALVPCHCTLPILTAPLSFDTTVV